MRSTCKSPWGNSSSLIASRLATVTIHMSRYCDLQIGECLILRKYLARFSLDNRLTPPMSANLSYVHTKNPKHEQNNKNKTNPKETTHPKEKKKKERKIKGLAATEVLTECGLDG